MGLSNTDWTQVHSGFAYRDDAVKAAKARKKLFPKKDVRIVERKRGTGKVYAILSRDRMG